MWFIEKEFMIETLFFIVAYLCIFQIMRRFAAARNSARIGFYLHGIIAVAASLIYIVLIPMKSELSVFMFKIIKNHFSLLHSIRESVITHLRTLRWASDL